MRKLLTILMIFTYMQAQAQQWAGIIDTSRAIDWNATFPGVTNAGGIGLLPDANWVNCTTAACQTLFPLPNGVGGSVTQTTIQNALASCPTNQVVRVPAGSFSLTGWKSTTNNCVLRGQGADQTLITLSNSVGGCPGITGTVGICFGSSSNNWKGGIANGPVNLSGTFTKGQTTLTFASVPSLNVGDIVIFDQDDDTTDTGGILISQSSSAITAGAPTCASTGQVAPCGTTGPVSLEGNGGGAQRNQKELSQIVTVTACNGSSVSGAACSGTNTAVTFSPGLAMPNWASGKNPQAWWATSPIQNFGIEDMSIDVTGAGSVPGIGIANATNGWVKGVRMINSNRSHVQLDYDQHITVRDSYFFLTLNSASQSYGVECDDSSDVLVENNILQAIVSPLMINGACTGAVYSYSYQINNYYTSSSRYNIPGTDLHTAGIDNLLFEGDYGNVFTGDVFHGSQNFVTVFRSRFTGPQPACYVSGGSYATSTFGTCNNSLNVMQILSYSRFHNFIGNILGTTGTNTNYQSGASNTKVWDVGSGNSNGTVTVPNDPNVLSGMMRWGNCDSASGFGSCRFVGSEVPSALTGAQSAFSNPVPASQSLPASFYYTAKPPWWTTGLAWPAIGPDVTGGDISGVGGHAWKIPAQRCADLIGIPSDGTGPVRTFNAATCYSTVPSPGPPPASSIGSFASNQISVSGEITAR
jgi:hypothetical protein